MSEYIPVFQEYVQSPPIELIELVDRGGVLTLSLEDSRDRRLTFQSDSVLCFRKMDEGDALVTLSRISKSSGTGKYFYRVDSSEFVDWFNRERSATPSVAPVLHYVVAAANDIVDMLCLEPPTLKWAGDEIGDD